jgi:nuclease HARBI1
MEIKPALE